MYHEPLFTAACFPSLLSHESLSSPLPPQSTAHQLGPHTKGPPHPKRLAMAHLSPTHPPSQPRPFPHPSSLPPLATVSFLPQTPHLNRYPQSPPSYPLAHFNHPEYPKHHPQNLRQRCPVTLSLLSPLLSSADDPQPQAAPSSLLPRGSPPVGGHSSKASPVPKLAHWSETEVKAISCAVSSKKEAKSVSHRASPPSRPLVSPWPSLVASSHCSGQTPRGRVS